MRAAVGIVAVLVVLWWFPLRYFPGAIQVVGLAAVAVFLAVMTWLAGLDRSPESSFAESVVKALEDIGHRYELAAIVAAWTALAVIAVLGVAFAISGFEPGRDSSAAEGQLVLGVFFGLLIGGPLVTLWIRRRR